MNRIIHHSVKLDCDSRRAFEMFTDNRLLETWLAQAADVEPRPGGRYELFWDPADRQNDSTQGCKVTAVEPGQFIAFEWKGPRQFKHFMNNANPLTHVVVFFIPEQSGGTNLHLIHSGWRDTPEWEEAREWFERSWAMALRSLATRAGS
jgi:uncharacterized protein YndB with AHSA1/START domain